MGAFQKKIKAVEKVSKKEEVKKEEVKIAEKKPEKEPKKTLAELAGNKEVVIPCEACGGGKIRFIKPVNYDEHRVCVRSFTHFDIPYWSLRHYQYNHGQDVWVLVEKLQGAELIRGELRVSCKTPKEGRKNVKDVLDKLVEMAKAIRDAERERENNV